MSKKSETAHPLREEFLKRFVRALIENSLSPEEKQKIIEEQFQRKEVIENLRVKIEPMEPKIDLDKPDVKGMIPSMIHSPPPQIRIPRTAPPIKMNLPVNPSAAGSINLGKITQFLSDPAVVSVESPGAGKNLMINRSGAIQTSPMSLTKEEIDAIMKEVSDKTRIPLSTGVFKAAFQNLIITAVLSDYIGTRFLIQKKNPFQKY